MLNIKYIPVEISLKESQNLILVSLALFKIVLGGLKCSSFIYFMYTYYILCTIYYIYYDTDYVYLTCRERLLVGFILGLLCFIDLPIMIYCTVM